jgi:hypothetical protein
MKPLVKKLHELVKRSSHAAEVNFFSRTHRRAVYLYIKKKRGQEPLKNTSTRKALP